MNFKFSEVTDMEMKIDFSLGADVLSEFAEGNHKRELFVIYEGPPMEKNRKEFFQQLQSDPTYTPRDISSHLVFQILHGDHIALIRHLLMEKILNPIFSYPYSMKFWKCSPFPK